MAEETQLRNRLGKALFNKIGVALSPNYSSRYGQLVKLSVVHTTESADESFQGILNYFRSRSSQASSSYVIDAVPLKVTDEFTRVTLCVPEKYKPWTQRSANPVAVSYELIGRARRTRQEWLGKYRAQIRTVAALVAEDCLQYKLPTKLSYPGYCGHVHLPTFGFPQDHTDPGREFPWDVFDKDVEEFYALGKKKGVPPSNTIIIPKAPRPAGTPKKIPKWAWKLNKWWLQPPAKRGPKPEAPKPLPDWFWPWRKWYLGLNNRPHDENV